MPDPYTCSLAEWIRTSKDGPMTDIAPKVSGTEPGQRQLNGPQTTGREYRNLSVPDNGRCPTSTWRCRCAMGSTSWLTSIVHSMEEATPSSLPLRPIPGRSRTSGRQWDSLKLAQRTSSCPEDMSTSSPTFAGTGGSEGTFGFHDAQERLDLYDLVEWAAEQPWSNGRVGMIGISYFAMTQLEAASEHPPHLEAIFPIATSSDLYEGVYHHGLFNSTFITPFSPWSG